MMAGAPREIERVWVLRSMPEVPAGAERWTIEQGYLPVASPESPDFPEGRLRRVTLADGSTRRFHTVKRGAGLVRQELEREIDDAEFARWWPATSGRRLRKIRHRFPHAGRTWELDEFLDLPLVMLEVELPDETAEAAMPAFLATLVEREVTEDARYRNFALAARGVPEPR
jgi:CYTH domain-containing protein